MDLLRAIEIAVDAHETDIDKGGNPYIRHPLRLMMQMDTDNERIIARRIAERARQVIDDYRGEKGRVRVLDQLFSP